MQHDLMVEASDGEAIPVSVAHPSTPPLGWIHITHGMGEHRRRYETLTHRLVAAGYCVSIHDHRGHGTSAATLGDFGPEGWSRLIQDLDEVLLAVQAAIAAHSMVLLGHSMGAVVSQHWLGQRSTGPLPLRGAVLSGHPGQIPSNLGKLLRWLIGFERKRLGGESISPILRYLVFGQANRGFRKEPPGSGYEWLSKDVASVQDYADDPYCGHFVTINSFDSMVAAEMEFWAQPLPLASESRLPVHFIAGEQDPLHDALKRLQPVMQAFNDGQWQLSADVYPPGRHEMFHAPVRDAVIDKPLDVLKGWD